MTVLLLLSLAWSCARSREEASRASPLEIRVVGRGEVEVVCVGPAAPDVRYSTSPVTAATWDEARAVGPWLPITLEGTPKLRSSLRGLPPVLHYLAAKRCGQAFASLSPVAAVLPLREAILHGRRGGHYFGHTVALVGDEIGRASCRERV